MDDVVDMLLTRMDTNPEDFFHTWADVDVPIYANRKFRHLAYCLRQEYFRLKGWETEGIKTCNEPARFPFFTDEQVLKLGDKLQEVVGVEFRQYVLQALLSEPQVECTVERASGTYPCT